MLVRGDNVLVRVNSHEKNEVLRNATAQENLKNRTPRERHKSSHVTPFTWNVPTVPTPHRGNPETDSRQGVGREVFWG